MHVLVLGAGVIGITTAYALARKGCKVTVIDRANSIAAGASHANGGQLSYSYVDPLASPQTLRLIPEILFGRSNSMRLNSGFDSHLMRWGLQFMRECTTGRNKQNLSAALALAQESQFALAALQKEHDSSFGCRTAGKLVVTRSASTLQAAMKKAELKRKCGQILEALSAAECFEISPGLGEQMGDLAGGLLAPNDGIGDARHFTETLAMMCTRDYGTDIKLKRHIRGLLVDRDRVVGVTTSKGEYTADAVVVAMGAPAAPFLTPYGIQLPILPMKGYSFSIPATNTSPKLSITDLDNRLVYAPLGKQIRIAGLADFDGFNPDADNSRLALLKEVAQQIMPEAGDYSHGCSGWAGQRAMTPNGLPIIGATKIRNLYLNVGHGMFGWTFACGSANRLVQAVFPRENKGRRVA